MAKKLTKFDFVVGNPPFNNGKSQIYTDFYLLGRSISNCVDMIFPTGWQEPKMANNLSKLNKKEIKEDKQIVLIDNKQNVFPGVTGAEWTNIIIWKKDYDNGLDGCQKILTNGDDEQITKLLCDKKEIELFSASSLSGADYRSVSCRHTYLDHSGREFRTCGGCGIWQNGHRSRHIYAS